MRTYLYLESGEVFEGQQFGYTGDATGELVFSTGMVGYTESLTDPSYAGQILVFTYPLIGNYGIPKLQKVAPHLMANMESERVQVRGVVTSSTEYSPSHYLSRVNFSSWLASQKIPGIFGIDTRRLTQLLRESGTLRARIGTHKKNISVDSTHLVSSVSIQKPIVYMPKTKHRKHIVLFDCGVKHGIIRALLTNGYKVTRIPWDSDPFVFWPFDGVVCSNGPGDPKDCKKTVASIQMVLQKRIPFLGVCLGHQLFALAIGADTYKLPYGHRGINQPCLDLRANKAYVTSQNHGYAVNKKTIPKGFEEWFINLNDQTSEGLTAQNQKAWSVQFHPEGHPGPYDTDWIFSLFTS